MVAGIAFAGWTIYSHIGCKDPLMEAFYKMSGGREAFEQLPEIQFNMNSLKELAAAINEINWDNLEHPITKSKTLDGRNILIIKGLIRNNEGFDDCQTKGVLAFVEKVGPYDLPRIYRARVGS
ncbi:MAG: hypothetical protein LW832_10745 [Parachlamydia sp.]|jgi:hypothetical protein|nr:hypothetical protein [Parachlamydia sp.]